MNINENITKLVALTKRIIEEINLAKFRKEVESSFLGLGFDECSRNYNKDYYSRKMIVLNPIPLRSYHPTNDCMNRSCLQDSELMKKYSDHQAINLAKFAKEVDKSSFLGLGFDPKVTVLNPIPLQSHSVSGCMDHDHENSSSNSSSVGKSELINLTAKFGKGLSGGTFLGLDIDRSSNYKIFNQDSDHTTRSGLENNSGNSITTVTDCSGKKRRSPNGNHNNNNNVKKMRLIRSHPEPITPPPELVQLIGSLIRPVFLYMKKLEESDVRKDQNRLFVNEREKLMEFLTEEERITAFAKEDEKITKPEGIDLIGIDRMGREYKLHLTKWGSLNKPVFNKEWYKIVDANGAKRGDCVHLWGYRKDDKFRLVVEFHHL
ncbi:hypothetical protein OROHE_001177 [Orobanche hederae]